MSEPKKLEDLSVLEINAQIGLRMELMERTANELHQLRQRREIQSKIEQLPTGDTK